MEFSKVLLDKISHGLRDRNESIASAESVTSGYLQLAFSQMFEAGKIYKGGITAYTLEQKVKHLRVNPEEALQMNCVSRNICETMAVSAGRLYDSDWSVATTGYATPVPESEQQIFAYYSIAYCGTIIRSDRIELHAMTKPLDAQRYYTEYILGCLACEVKRNYDYSKVHNRDLDPDKN